MWWSGFKEGIILGVGQKKILKTDLEIPIFANLTNHKYKRL
jgi:hypothetical protein